MFGLQDSTFPFCPHTIRHHHRTLAHHHSVHPSRPTIQPSPWLHHTTVFLLHVPYGLLQPPYDPLHWPYSHLVCLLPDTAISLSPLYDSLPALPTVGTAPATIQPPPLTIWPSCVLTAWHRTNSLYSCIPYGHQLLLIVHYFILPYGLSIDHCHTVRPLTYDLSLDRTSSFGIRTIP